MSSSRVPRFIPRLSRGRPASVPSKVAPQKISTVLGAKSKVGPVAVPERDIATAPAPAPDQGQAEARLYVQTYFTKVTDETQILYNGDRQWTRVTVTLETAGPVAIGTVQKISPVLSGKGILLTTDEPFTLTVAKGTRLYIVSTSVNRVRVQIEAVAWLEQITGTLRSLVGRFALPTGRREK